MRSTNHYLPISVIFWDIYRATTYISICGIIPIEKFILICYFEINARTAMSRCNDVAELGRTARHDMRPGAFTGQVLAAVGRNGSSRSGKRESIACISWQQSYLWDRDHSMSVDKGPGPAADQYQYQSTEQSAEQHVSSSSVFPF